MKISAEVREFATQTANLCQANSHPKPCSHGLLAYRAPMTVSGWMTGSFFVHGGAILVGDRGDFCVPVE
jgi:hypothetical protein